MIVIDLLAVTSSAIRSVNLALVSAFTIGGIVGPGAERPRAHRAPPRLES